MRSYFPSVTAPCTGILTDEAVVTARDLWARHARYVDLPADLLAVTGRLPAAPFLLALYGPPGAGKSHLVYRLADALADATGRPVVIASTEEALGPQVSARLRRLEILRNDLLITAANDLGVLLDLLRRHRAAALVVDSLTYSTLSGADLARLAREEEIAVIYTMQATKDGGARGPLGLLHHADVVIALATGGGWRREKTRFDSPAEGATPWAGEEAKP
ncbi:MAG: hypothetical protein HY722_00410 [Planctomycetes bacterium]|nr:hypothetical protein [Planctomycetota bacterium]